MDRNELLLTWYRDHGRGLPWRGDSDPWRVLVVEVMSQQTQVSRVAARFGPFLARFATPRDLADAPAEEAVRLWGDLGYLRRLHHLRRAARVIADEGWPHDLTALPGVGAYTAAAVACFAHGAAVPTVDTNHRRVLSRWSGRPLAGAELLAAAEAAIDPAAPAAWNQAVMDLGATVCLPVPDCGACPVAAFCADPSVYLPPARQSRFEGSLRQTRARVVRALSAGPATTEALTQVCGERTARALAALLRDAIVMQTAEGWRLA